MQLDVTTLTAQTQYPNLPGHFNRLDFTLTTVPETAESIAAATKKAKAMKSGAAKTAKIARVSQMVVDEYELPTTDDHSKFMIGCASPIVFTKGDPLPLVSRCT